MKKSTKKSKRKVLKLPKNLAKKVKETLAEARAYYAKLRRYNKPIK